MMGLTGSTSKALGWTSVQFVTRMVLRAILLMCDFCPKAFHHGCVGLEICERAQKGDWLCADCRKADDLTRLDAKSRGWEPRSRKLSTQRCRYRAHPQR